MSEDLFAKALIVLTIMRQAVAEHMLPVFQQPDGLTIETKLDKTIVTNVDRTVENFLMAQLGEQFPEADIIGEECIGDDPELMNLIARKNPLWIIDALDGTYSFAMGQPGWGILISYMENWRTRHVHHAGCHRRSAYHRDCRLWGVFKHPKNH